jgi:cysteinyl-tRNA synthetase
MSLVLYNTLTKEKEPFRPMEPNKVKIYLCGPTVYDLLHIGNFRGAIFFNLMRNWLVKTGHEVTFVYNYTDVDDKIIKRANDEGVDSREISERYIQEFRKDFDRLGLVPHDHNPKVTDFIPQIVEFVERLIDRNKAYVIDGEVFYSIDSFDDYGKLSGKKIDELEAGQRVDVDQRKKNPHDFVLWKPSKAGEPAWPSPWGQGRPGWHIECSAMIQSILGETIDIHGGGIDLIFPHHENEIAQGEGATGCRYCNYWVHNNFINIKDQKMSKSLGNVIRAREFMDKYHPEVLKFLMLTTHYRSMLSLSEEKIQQAAAGLVRVYTALQASLELAGTTGNLDPKNVKDVGGLKESMLQADQAIEKALNDDFNTGEVFARLFEVVRSYNGLNLGAKKKTPEHQGISALFAQWILGWGSLLALFQEKPADFLNELNEILIRERGIDRARVEELIKERGAAREQKNWARADEIRDELYSLGIDFKDTPEGTTWSVKVSS